MEKLKALFNLKVFFCEFVILVVTVTAQSWDKKVIRDNWGDESGHFYEQSVTSSGKSSFFDGTDNWRLSIRYEENGNITIYISVIAGDRGLAAGLLGLDPLVAQLLISETESGRVPIVPRSETNVAVSLRDESKNVQKFVGTMSARHSSMEHLVILCNNNSMKKILETDGKLQILIEGENWHVRANIVGNLPTALNRERLEEPPPPPPAQQRPGGIGYGSGSAPAPATQGATIFIATIPPKAKVYIGGRLIGTSNEGELTVPVGTHQVRFVKDGLEKTESITFQPGKNQTRFVNLDKSSRSEWGSDW